MKAVPSRQSGTRLKGWEKMSVWAKHPIGLRVLSVPGESLPQNISGGFFGGRTMTHFFIFFFLQLCVHDLKMDSCHF